MQTLDIQGKVRFFIVLAGSLLAGTLLIFRGAWLAGKPSPVQGSRPAETGPSAIGLLKHAQVPSGASRSPSKPIPGPITGQVKGNPKDGLQYVWIPPGSFLMGCSEGDKECFAEELPTHTVKLTQGFWLGQTEVTVGAYKRFARSTGAEMPNEPKLLGRPLNPGWQDDSMPMVNVNWTDAHDYCVWADGRLPTEAEWEYGARAGSAEARYGPIDEVAWTADNSGREPIDSARALKEDPQSYPARFKDNLNSFHPVGQKRPNAFGLYDMLGNAWEWVNDWYDGEYYQSSPAADPQGPATGDYRVMRGGSWIDPPWNARVSYRGLTRPDFGGPNHGFRCVWDGGR